MKLTAADVKSAQNILSADEWCAFGRIKSEKIREWRLGARAFLRTILGAYTDTPAAEIKFAYGAAGKPRLEFPDTGLQFSVSHTDEIVSVAISWTDTGIDLEKATAAGLIGSVVSRTMTDAERCLVDTKIDKMPYYLRLWTLKEAVAKAMGDGLTLDLKLIDGSSIIDSLVGEFASQSHLAIGTRCWRIVRLELASELVATLALGHPIDRLRYFSLAGFPQ